MLLFEALERVLTIECVGIPRATFSTPNVASFGLTEAAEGGYSELAHLVHGHPTLSEVFTQAVRALMWLIHGEPGSV